MPKWLIWTLLELSTFLLIANLVFLWLSRALHKKQQLNEQDNDPNALAESSPEGLEPLAHKSLAHYLDTQINFAASAIVPTKLDQHEINQLKIWGTVLKAERAILLNQVSEKPKPILNRFLSSLLYALSAPKLQTTDPNELKQNLKAMEDEFYQATELLITKESLTKNQQKLNEDIRDNIDRARKRLRQLDIKKVEHQRLQLEVSDLQKKIKILEQSQNETRSEIQFDLKMPKAHQVTKETRGTSFKQIAALSNLSDRQKMVIDQLRSEIEKARKNDNANSALEAQKVAISKMERMSQESQSLIVQLEQELELSNLSISSLRQDISIKDAKLAELERQLSQSNETAIGNLQALSANKKETLVSLRDGLNTALESNSTSNLREQEKDTKALERLLQESETCVTLLAQELESAEKTNDELKEKIHAIGLGGNGATPQTKLLEQLREKNRQLVQDTTDLKQKLTSMVSSKDYQALRVTYNKKSLECDRLQLAFSDLEMKYLGTLKN